MTQNSKPLKDVTMLIIGQGGEVMDTVTSDDKGQVEKQLTLPVDFTADYSILPAGDKFVNAGNWVLGENGWIDHKFHFVNVLKNGNAYKIIGLATGR